MTPPTPRRADVVPRAAGSRAREAAVLLGNLPAPFGLHRSTGPPLVRDASVDRPPVQDPGLAGTSTAGWLSVPVAMLSG